MDFSSIEEKAKGFFAELIPLLEKHEVIYLSAESSRVSLLFREGQSSSGQVNRGTTKVLFTYEAWEEAIPGIVEAGEIPEPQISYQIKYQGNHESYSPAREGE